MQIAVYPLVFDKGAVLALQSKDGDYRLPMTFLREGETLQEAAARALKKETNITAIALQFVGIYDEVARNPAARELAAVMLARSWRENTGEAPHPESRWVSDTDAASFILDQNFILAEQRCFAPLCHKFGGLLHA